MVVGGVGAFARLGASLIVTIRWNRAIRVFPIVPHYHRHRGRLRYTCGMKYGPEHCVLKNGRLYFQPPRDVPAFFDVKPLGRDNRKARALGKRLE
jgi:hypothetical protein